MNKKVLLGIVLFCIGAVGIASMYGMALPLPDYMLAELEKQFSPGQISLLMMINPSLMLIGCVLIGTFMFEGAKLRVPVIARLVGLNEDEVNWAGILSKGLLFGVIAGVLLSLISVSFMPYMPEQFIELGEKVKPTLAMRFLYGGFTEEILMRFGLMTFVVWLMATISGGHKQWIYWLGIVIAAIVFGFGHFPIVSMAVEEPTLLLYTYILVGNSVGGLIFGWLYWKQGLEAAFVAHIMTHVVMLIAESFMA